MLARLDDRTLQRLRADLPKRCVDHIAKTFPPYASDVEPCDVCGKMGVDGLCRAHKMELDLHGMVLPDEIPDDFDPFPDPY